MDVLCKTEGQKLDYCMKVDHGCIYKVCSDQSCRLGLGFKGLKTAVVHTEGYMICKQSKKTNSLYEKQIEDASLSCR